MLALNRMSSKISLSLSAAALVCVTIVGCNNNKNDDSVRVRGADAGTAPMNTANTKAGMISNSYAMTNDVQNFLVTGNLAANQIGTVDATGSVYFIGQIHFDNSSPQNLISATSWIQLQIWDSFAKSGQYKPFDIKIGPNAYATGQYNGSQAQMTFKDAYGSLVLQGTVSNAPAASSVFSGNVWYTNSTTGQQGFLGQFSISTCSFFSCN